MNNKMVINTCLSTLESKKQTKQRRRTETGAFCWLSDGRRCGEFTEPESRMSAFLANYPPSAPPPTKVIVFTLKMRIPGVIMGQWTSLINVFQLLSIKCLLDEAWEVSRIPVYPFPPAGKMGVGEGRHGFCAVANGKKAHRRGAFPEWVDR